DRYRKCRTGRVLRRGGGFPSLAYYENGEGMGVTGGLQARVHSTPLLGHPNSLVRDIPHLAAGVSRPARENLAAFLISSCANRNSRRFLIWSRRSCKFVSKRSSACSGFCLKLDARIFTSSRNRSPKASMMGMKTSSV